ncbi:O-antigen ligase family protein [Thiobacillus sp.]
MRLLISPLLLIGGTLLAAVGVDWSADLTWHDQHRLGQIGLLAVMTAGGLTIWRQDIVASIMRLPRWVRMALAWAFGLGLVSVFTAGLPRFAALEWATLLLLPGLALLLAKQAALASVPFDKWATRLVVALAVVIALKIMTGYLAAMIEMGRLDTIMLFEGTFSNRRFFGQVASMAIPLLAYPLLRGGLSGSARAVLFVLLAVWWMLVIVSGTRGTWVALALAAVVLGVFAWRACAAWLRIQALAFGAGALLFGILFVWLPFWIGADASLENRIPNILGLSGRGELWALAWVQIQAHPWLGVGPMHLAAIPAKFGAHPHNAVLQLAAEWGVPAALAFIFVAASGLLHLLVRLRQEVSASPNPLLACLTASLLAAGAQSMVDGVIVIPYTQTFLVLVAGWALGVYFRDALVTAAVSGSRIMRFGIPVLSLFALAALLNGAFPEAFNRAEATQAFRDAGNTYLPPRYWVVGRIP